MAGDARTICALASAPGGALRAVLRISGPDAARIVRASCRARGRPPELAARGLAEVRFHDGRGEQPALLLWMPGPASYTREDVAELHLPGSPPLVHAALERLLALGALPAGPGEFTRRAFLNGRLDLTRAEGVLGLVSARSREERRAASALLAGGLDRRLAAVRDALEAVRALAEASLDFDEADTGHVPQAELLTGLERARERLADARRWERARVPASGLPRVVLAGAPNAGKSALFNAFLGEGAFPGEGARAGEGRRVLVSDLPGTTRDAQRATVALGGGRRCVLVDTAGLDPAAEGVDAQAQELASVEREAADLWLWVVDATRGGPPPPEEGDAPVLVAWNKTDLAGAPAEPPLAAVAVSATTGAGLERLRHAVGEALSGARGAGGPEGLGRVLSARHLRALDDSLSAVGRAAELLAGGAPLDLVAETLREATDALDAIHGRTTPDALLDRIFAEFCIGK